jgi:hypothetical protein
MAAYRNWVPNALPISRVPAAPAFVAIYSTWMAAHFALPPENLGLGMSTRYGW